MSRGGVFSIYKTVDVCVCVCWPAAAAGLPCVMDGGYTGQDGQTRRAPCREGRAIDGGACPFTNT